MNLKGRRQSTNVDDRRGKGGYHDRAETFQANAENGRSRQRAEKRCVKGRITRKDEIRRKDRRGKRKRGDRKLPHTLKNLSDISKIRTGPISCGSLKSITIR